jgi:hypothetical protein
MATYADSLLAEGEVVVHRDRQHWLSLLLESRLAIVLWAIAAIALVLVLLFRLTGNTATIASGVALVAIILGLIVLLFRWWEWRTTEFLITNRRLINVSGILNKRSGDSSLEKINDAILEENLLGRILNYGDLDILTAADIAIDRYRMLNHAKDFKKLMLAAKHALEQSVGGPYDMPTPPIRQAATPPPLAPAAAAAPVPSAAPVAAPPVAADDPGTQVTAALGQLAQLRDSGAISASEYEAKKEELLGRL